MWSKKGHLKWALKWRIKLKGARGQFRIRAEEKSLGWASPISNLLVLSAEVTGAFGADADNQARERLVLAFVFIAFSFGVSCLRFSYHVA